MDEHDSLAERFEAERPRLRGNAFAPRARQAGPALVDGAPGLIVAPRGRLQLALRLAVEGERIVEIDVIADPERLRRLDVAVAPMRTSHGAQRPARE